MLSFLPIFVCSSYPFNESDLVWRMIVSPFSRSTPLSFIFSLPLCLLAKGDKTIDEPIESHAFSWKRCGKNTFITYFTLFARSINIRLPFRSSRNRKNCCYNVRLPTLLHVYHLQTLLSKQTSSGQITLQYRNIQVLQLFYEMCWQQREGIPEREV